MSNSTAVKSPHFQNFQCSQRLSAGTITLTVMGTTLYFFNPEAMQDLKEKKAIGGGYQFEIDKRKVKQTMMDMRAVGTAVEAYNVDNNQFPEAADMEALAKLVQPTYIKTFPIRDQWNHRFEYRVWEDPEHGEGMQHYSIISLSSDGLSDRSDYKIKRVSTNLGDDLVFSEGSFVHFPEAFEAY
jgi:Type II secretion system (T2SS), protein G